MFIPIAMATSSLPSNSILFTKASGNFLSIPDADFGTFNRAKFGISLWVKRASTGTAQRLYCQGGVTPGTSSFFLMLDSGDTITFNTSQDGSGIAGALTTTATYTSMASFYHIVVTYDSANATANNRMRMYVNGTEVTVFNARANPTAQVFNSSATINVANDSDGGGSGHTFDGRIYQASFFSDTLPDPVAIYNAGLKADVTTLAGLRSVLDATSVTHDGVLASSWTNTNTATLSSTIP